MVEKMFRSFAACAMRSGALNPLHMVCPDAGVPVGMHQLDGGVTYPLGGMLIRAGVDPLAAWKLSVATLVVAGTVALCWLLRRLTGSSLLATTFVVISALSATPSARSWDWYWRVTGSALLPMVFAAAYALYVRGPQRRLHHMVPPALALFASVLAVGLEWQYAGLFAATTAATAMLLLTLQRGWTGLQRALLAGWTAVGLGTVFAILRWRLALAGITGQLDNALDLASEGSVDLASFVVPDGPMSLLGRAITLLGRRDLLVRSMVEYRQLWVAPYLGVLVAGFLLVLLAVRRSRLRDDPGRPRGFLLLLSAIAVASVVFALGPMIDVADLAQPTWTLGSPVGLLYDGTPLQWIRFPRTWIYLLRLALLLIYAAAASALLRDRAGRWSPLLGVLVVLLALDFVSPQVLGAFDDPRPSIELAPPWNRIDSDDPAAVRFAAQQQPQYERALQGFGGPVVVLPWRNLWGIASLGPDTGIQVRSVGIDRNLAQAVDAAPFSADELEHPTTGTMQRMLDTDWAAAVVLLDHTPYGTSIERYERRQLSPGDIGRQAWRWRHQTQLARRGYCVDEHPWFTVIADCGAKPAGSAEAPSE